MRIRTAGGLIGLLALGGSLGCNSFDEPPDAEDAGPKLVIPVDERPAVAAPVTPLAISGGTLSIVADGRYAVAADPERDRLSIVDLQSSQLINTIELEPGSQPGRSVESTDGLVHVALRGSGEVVTVDVVNGTVRERRVVCKSPRGIAFEPAAAALHVACVEGKLVTLTASGLDVVRSLTLETDLRDVLVRGSELWVTRFKSADVLRIDAGGAVASRVVLPTSAGQLTQPLPADRQDFGGVALKEVTMQSGVAWRTVPTQSGGAVMVHQQAVVDEVEITEPTPSGGSAYGGGGFSFDCSSGIVKNVVTTIAADGGTVTTPFMGPPLAVDIAVSPDQQWVAIAHAGPADLEAPRPSVVFRDEHGGFSAPGSPGPLSLNSFSLLHLPSAGGACALPEGRTFDVPVVAVAFSPQGLLVAQTREPAQLAVIHELHGGAPTLVGLGGETRLDTGHELFHRDSGGGIACASCHPEAGEDGHVWSFAGTGLRRTQALHVGLRDTAPFHWNGDLADVGALMTEVFVGRMGGVRQSPARLSALSEWLFSLEPPPPLRDADDEAVTRGRALFESPAVGCSGCHSGEKLTNNETVAVVAQAGAAKLQVPSLIGIGYRAPFMHDGCAATLLGRFDPACGGDAHGNTGGLSANQLDDLVAYLESL